MRRLALAAALLLGALSAAHADGMVYPPTSTPGGPAGGDLSGDYPNPTVAKVNGTSPATCSSNQWLTSIGVCASIPFSALTSTPTTLSGYGITSPLPVAQGGTAASSASGTALDNITGFSSTGLIDRTGAGAYSFLGLPLSISNGGTGASTQAAAIAALMPTPTRAGDIAYWNGSAWTTLAGNNSGTEYFSENSSGTPAWASPSGSGTVTSVVCGNITITSSGYCPPLAPQGRLTLTANTPVMTASVTGQTTLRYDCYHGGNLVPVYNGTNDIVLAIGSCEITDAMASSGTGVLSSTNVFDIWAVNVSGTLTLCVATNGSGGGWASDTGGSNTSRGTGYTQLDTTTRPYITNKNSLADCYNGSTNEGSIAANEATYLGTFFTSGAGTTQYVFPTIASTPVAGTFLLWNYYNRVNVSGTVGDSTSDWTYGSTTIREIHGDATAIVEYVIGVAEDAETATSIEVINAGSAGFAGGGIGHNSTSAYSGITGAGPSASEWGNSIGNFSTIDLGLNYVAQLESVNAADTQTFYGANGAGGNGTGMTFTGRF